jgi:uncharacterized protein YggU (UPF0235/DUF167 family)
MHDGVIKIRVAATPIENAANLALIDFVAQHLGIAKRYVRVVSRHSGSGTTASPIPTSTCTCRRALPNSA